MRTVLLGLLACLLPGTAHAGRSFYGWLYGTEVMPERGAELQTWIYETNEKYGTDVKETSIWWGPQIGVTDQLEISLPIEMYWTSSPDKPGFHFRRYGVEARYRLAVPDPVEAPPLVPLVRLAVKRDVTERGEVRLEGDVVLSYESGPVHVLVDVGLIADVAAGRRHAEVRPGGGVSIRVVEDLRLGAELYSELSLDSNSINGVGSGRWVALGPNLAWTHGRFWLSATFGIGVYHIRTAPRVTWGIAF